MSVYAVLEQIAMEDFGDVVVGCRQVGRRANAPLKLRLDIRDGTFVDIWLAPDGNRYAYHWEQRAKRGLIHRHDNAPDHPTIATHPKHFHNGAESIVEESHIPDEPKMALHYFLKFVRERLIQYQDAG
jgi:hypothetical protein